MRLTSLNSFWAHSWEVYLMPVADEEAWAQELIGCWSPRLSLHGSDVASALALSSISEPAHRQPVWVCAAWCPWWGLARTRQHHVCLWAQSASPEHPVLASNWGFHWGWNYTAVSGPGRAFWLHLLFLPPSSPCLLWWSSQASSESWAGWKWGICPFFPCLLSLLMFLLELRELWCQITPSW